jgi:hypothetical protein
VTAIQYISQLGAVASVGTTDILPVTQGSTGPLTGTTRKATVAQLFTSPTFTGTTTLGSNLANYLTITGAASGSSPVFAAAGSDATIGFRFTPKNRGQSRFDGGILQNYAQVVSGSVTPWLYTEATLSGTSGASPANTWKLNLSDTLDASIPTAYDVAYIGHIMNAGMKGGRIGLRINSLINGQPGDYTTNPNGFYLSQVNRMTVAANFTSGASNYGNAICYSATAQVNNGASISLLEAMELGAGVLSGGVANYCNVLKLSPRGGVGSGGGAFSFNGLAFSCSLNDPGFTVGIAFGGAEGNGWPIATTGKLIAITNPNGTPAKTVAYGIDFVSVACTFTTAAFASPGFLVDGSGTTTTTGMLLATRVVTAAGAVTVGATDDVVIVNKTVGAATTVNLPAGVTKRRYIIKDGKGDAAANNITITPAAGTIDGAATLVINTNYGRATIIYNGTQWNQI